LRARLETPELETIFQKPVLDQTASEALFEWKSKGEMNPGGE
jgi:hypothetical protein